MRRAIDLIERVTCAFGRVGAALVLLLIFAMSYEVVMRYVFNAPTIWAYEVASMLMGTSFLITIAYAMVTRSHVRVDFLYARADARGRALIDLAGYVGFLLPVALWMTWGLWNYLTQAYTSGETTGQSAWNPVVWPFRVAYVAGFFLFSLQIAAEIMRCVLVLRGEEVPQREGQPDIAA
jgi:TRAP-type mannitol/chloroaromatic compound transport system permease small subunit